MKYLMVCVLLLAGDLVGQVGSRKSLQSQLTSELMALQHADRDTVQATDELTSTLMASSEADHRPSRAAVAVFARELTKILSGRELPAAAANQVATNVIGVLHSAGTGTSEFRQLISRFEKTLAGVGLSAAAAQRVAAKLTNLGKEVRGPQDTPLLPLR